MKRLVLLAATLLLGCDDPAVEAKVLDVLEHGSVSAFLECDVTFTHTSVGTNRALHYTATRFQDASALTTAALTNYPYTAFWPRGHANAATNRANIAGYGSSYAQAIEVEAAGGYLTVDGTSIDVGDTVETLAISTYCTGFNLDAFD